MISTKLNIKSLISKIEAIDPVTYKEFIDMLKSAHKSDFSRYEARLYKVDGQIVQDVSYGCYNLDARCHGVPFHLDEVTASPVGGHLYTYMYFIDPILDAIGFDDVWKPLRTALFDLKCRDRKSLVVRLDFSQEDNGEMLVELHVN